MKQSHTAEMMMYRWHLTLWHYNLFQCWMSKTSSTRWVHSWLNKVFVLVILWMKIYAQWKHNKTYLKLYNFIYFLEISLHHALPESRVPHRDYANLPTNNTEIFTTWACSCMLASLASPIRSFAINFKHYHPDRSQINNIHTFHSQE